MYTNPFNRVLASTYVRNDRSTIRDANLGRNPLWWFVLPRHYLLVQHGRVGVFKRQKPAHKSEQDHSNRPDRIEKVAYQWRK